MVYSPDEYDVGYLAHVPLVKNKPGNPGTKNRRKYLNIVTAFDIETSKTPDRDESHLYEWQWQFGPDDTVIGRTWEQLEIFARRVMKAAPETLVVLVHNLSYEFQFLRTIFDFKTEDVFCVKSHKVLKANYRNLEYRCTYLHSNSNLASYLKKMGVEHKKVEGYDHTKIRYPWTPLDEQEQLYGINDVRGLVEAYTTDMRLTGDTLATIPMTSTGYVRRDVKNATYSDHRWMKKLLPEDDLYYLLREAFRGGNTHANRFYVGDILTNVNSADRSSSYPDVIINDRFPVTKFVKASRVDMDDGGAWLVRLRLYGVRLRDKYWGFPYLSLSKCWYRRDVMNDNGRVLQAAEVGITVTDVDWRIIEYQYKWDKLEIEIGCAANYGTLPDGIRDTVKRYYTDKTRLKGVTGAETEYQRSKELLNSIYGMMAQDPLKDRILYIGGGEPYKVEGKPNDELLAKYRRKGWLPYQWGCWVTAHARYRLEEGLRLAGDGAVYCDTDSVKYVDEVDWRRYNAVRRAASESNGAWADDPSGERHYMGVFEAEHAAETFRTWGAKKYVATYDGEATPHVTIAGVNKKMGGEELRHIENFAPGFVFRKSAAPLTRYNNRPRSTIEVDGHRLTIGSNIALLNNTYTVSLTEEYIRILSDPELLDLLKRRFEK